MSQIESAEQVTEPNGDSQPGEPKIEPTGASQETCELKSEPAEAGEHHQTSEPASEEPQSEQPVGEPQSEPTDGDNPGTCDIKAEPTEAGERQHHQTSEPASEEAQSAPKGEPTEGETKREPTTTIESTGEPVVAETQEVSSTRNEDNHEENQSKENQQQPKQHHDQQHQHNQKGHIHSKQHSIRSSSRRPSYTNSTGRMYASGYQNYGLAYLPYKSNFEPSEDAKRRADEFLQTLKL